MILNEDNPSMKTDPECHKQSNQKTITLKVVRTVFYMFKKLSRPMEDIKNTQVKLQEINTLQCPK